MQPCSVEVYRQGFMDKFMESLQQSPSDCLHCTLICPMKLRDHSISLLTVSCKQVTCPLSKVSELPRAFHASGNKQSFPGVNYRNH